MLKEERNISVVDMWDSCVRSRGGEPFGSVISKQRESPMG